MIQKAVSSPAGAMTVEEVQADLERRRLSEQLIFTLRE